MISRVRPSKNEFEHYSVHNSLSLLRLLVHLFLKRWSCFGESARSSFDNVTSPVGLHSQFSRISSFSITSRLTSYTDNSRVNGSRDAIIFLLVDFWQMELLPIVSRSLLDILFGRRITDRLHHEPLDGLVLWNTSSG